MIRPERIKEAETAIRKAVIRTPLVHSPTLSGMFSGDIYLKLENLQKTGSFKIRGAVFKMMASDGSIGPKGVVAASAGNHAQGVALAASEAGFPATIVMPEWASISKQEATRSYGGKVILFGQTILESLEHAKALSADGRMLIHPYDDEDIIAGQGTIGLEILEQLSDVDTIVVPVGGGGLIAGIAAAVKDARPSTRVVGVQAAACPSAAVSIEKGSITTVDAKGSIADGILVRKPGRLTFPVLQHHVDRMVLVQEEHIASAILLLLERKKILAEGAGAAPLAALVGGGIRIRPGEKTVLVVSGGNVDSPLLGRVIGKGLSQNGRVVRLTIQLNDTPGSLAAMLKKVAALEANVLHIHHQRYLPNTPLFFTRVELELETRGFDHAASIVASLKAEGYAVDPEYLK